MSKVKEEVKKMDRRIRTLIRYNASVQTVVSETGITKEEAQECIRKFNEAYPEARRFLSESK